MLPFGFIKMLMNVDFGDNSIHFLISVFLVAIAYFAWRSTNIREQPHYHTVLLLERRRRTNRSRLTTHIQSTSIVTGVQIQTEAAVGTSSDNQTINNSQTTEANKPPEANTSTNPRDTNNRNPDNIPGSSAIEEREFETIVEIMDADAHEVRRRRLAYYENRQQGEPVARAGTSSESLNSSPLPENIVDELLDNSSDEPIMEHNYAERELGDDVEIQEEMFEDDSDITTETVSKSIRIKLKYLNDELKLVDGRLEEQLGDFKRRHFNFEFSTNKLVRLIFNGQVLQPDTETLQSCGLFDNCVVHCLIHQQRSTSHDSTNNSANAGNTNGLPQGNNNNNNNQGRDWDLGNILFALVSLILTSAWYFRYEYAHLYNVTATVALVAITGIFTIFLVGVYFPDYEQPRVPRQ